MPNEISGIEEFNQDDSRGTEADIDGNSCDLGISRKGGESYVRTGGNVLGKEVDTEGKSPRKRSFSTKRALRSILLASGLASLGGSFVNADIEGNQDLVNEKAPISSPLLHEDPTKMDQAFNFLPSSIGSGLDGNGFVREDYEIENSKEYREADIKCGMPTGELESIRYRGATISWERGNPIPGERIAIFMRVIDSLTDDIPRKYSIDKVSMNIFYLSEMSYYFGERLSVPNWSILSTNRITNKIHLSPYFVDSNQPLERNSFQATIGPQRSFDENQVFDSSTFAMYLVHEYVHVLQNNFPDKPLEYAYAVGWESTEEGIKKPPGYDEVFYSVLRGYSLRNHREDMADAIMYSYICSNDLGGLSPARVQQIDLFWGRPREEYCQEFD